MSETKIYVPIKYDNNEWLPNDVIVVYAIINLMIHGQRGEKAFINVDMIASTLFNTLSISPSQKKRVKNVLIELYRIEPRLFFDHNKDMSAYVLNISNWNISFMQEYSYTYLYASDIYKMLANQNIKPFVHIGFYYKLVSTFSYKYNIGFLSINSISKMINISTPSISNHLKTLKENHFLGIMNRKPIKLANDKFYKQTNIYYRPSDVLSVYKYLQSDKEQIPILSPSESA